MNAEDRYCNSIMQFANGGITQQNPLPEELFDIYVEYQLYKTPKTLEELEQDLAYYNKINQTVCNKYSQLILWLIENRHPLKINGIETNYIPKPEYFNIPE